MRKSLFLLPLLICGTPALAQPAATEVPPQIADPALTEKLANTAQALSRAVLDLPVGEIQAAVEGREPTAADKRLTVRDLARRDDPAFELKLREQIAEAKPRIEQSMKVVADAWPSVVQGLKQAQRSLERAAANMPDPTYPKR
jgi:hypothetical protein